MDSPSPAKRRKLSPDAASTNSGLRGSPIRRRSGRESFMTPTKASLARFNPNLIRNLERSKDKGQPSTSKGVQERESKSRHSLPAPAAVSGGRGLNSSPSRRAISRNDVDAFRRKTTIGLGEQRTPQSERRLETVSESGQGSPAAQATNAASGSSSLDSGGESSAGRSRLTEGERRDGEETLGRSRWVGQIQSASPLGEEDELSSSSPLQPQLAGTRRQKRPANATGKNSAYDEDSTSHEADSAKATAFDPELQRKVKTREDLSKDLRNLKASVTEYENGIKKCQLLGQEDLLRDQQTLDALISLLAESEPSEAPEIPKPFDIGSFLPFAKITPLDPLAETTSSSKSDDEIPSHRPVELKDQLAHLRAFTPMKYSLKTTLAEQPSTRNPETSLAHKITITSPHSLLSATLDIIHSAEFQAITKIELSFLSIWAESELGSWIRQHLPENNLNHICWAVARYWEAAEQRARILMQCEREFLDLLDATTSGRRGSTETQSLIHNLPTTKITFSSKDTVKTGPQLTIQYPVTFDWTGEPVVKVSAQAAIPGSWNEADDLGSLGRISELFARLVDHKPKKARSIDEVNDGHDSDDEGVNIMGAIRAVVKVLF